MRYYLLSNIKCALKINGQFLGYVENNLACFDFCGEFLIEFIPYSNIYNHISFIFNSNLQQQNVWIIDLYDGLLIIPKFNYKPVNKFCHLYANAFTQDNLRVNILCDSYYKLIVENKNDLQIITLNYLDNDCKVCSYLSNNKLIVTIKNKIFNVYVFDVSEKIKLILNENCEQIYFDNNALNLTFSYNNVTKCVKYVNYALKDFSLSDNFVRDKQISKLPIQLIPYAFLQEVKHNLGYTDYLCEGLKAHSSLIPQFFSDLKFFIPPFDDNNEFITVIGEKANKLKFDVSGSLIENFYYE